MEEKINVFFSPEFEGMTLAEQFQKFGEVASKLADASAFARTGYYESAQEFLAKATEEISALKCNSLMELAVAVREYITGLGCGANQPEDIRY